MYGRVYILDVITSPGTIAIDALLCCILFLENFLNIVDRLCTCIKNCIHSLLLLFHHTTLLLLHPPGKSALTCLLTLRRWPLPRDSGSAISTMAINHQGGGWLVRRLRRYIAAAKNCSFSLMTRSHILCNYITRPCKQASSFLISGEQHLYAACLSSPPNAGERARLRITTSNGN